MRKYISILILLASAAVHTACNESTVTMDDSVDVRVDSAMKGYQAQLAGAEFGWFADIETSKGFYRFWMDFADNNMVTMFTDNLDYPELNGIPRTSTYMFHAYQRPVLTFDTYNYLHIISDPNDAISGGTGNLGLKTDFEFEIDEVTDDVFTMTGRINRIKATLTRATEAEMQAVKQGQLQEALRNAPSYKQNLFCYMDVNGLTVDVKLSTRTVMFLYKVGNVTQIEAVETHTDIVTKDLVFDTPVTINGVEIKGLNYHADTDNFTTDSDTPILIQAKSKANIGMEACFGVEKYYTILRVEDGMFPSTNESENYLGYLMHNIFQMKLLLTPGIASFSHINLYFGLDTEGNSQLTVAPVIGGIGQEVRYTYQITFNQAEDSFTIDGSTLSMDSTAESFNDGSVYNLTEFLKNKTFKIEWTNVASIRWGSCVPRTAARRLSSTGRSHRSNGKFFQRKRQDECPAVFVPPRPEGPVPPYSRIAGHRSPTLPASGFSAVRTPHPLRRPSSAEARNSRHSRLPKRHFPGRINFIRKKFA